LRDRLRRGDPHAMVGGEVELGSGRAHPAALCLTIIGTALLICGVMMLSLVRLCD
jgi:hypothetical protein